MNPETQRTLHSSKEANWRTPKPMFDRLDAEFAFGVDAAASGKDCCDQWFGPGSVTAVDGLTCSWWDLIVGDPTVFLNPPYSRELGLPIEPWIEKCYVEARAGCTVVAILPHAVQTKWFQRYVWGITPNKELYVWEGFAATEVRQIPHRVTFEHPDGTTRHNAPGNTCVVIWRPDPGYVGPWTPTVRYWSFR